jgi:hypothetical protein
MPETVPSASISNGNLDLLVDPLFPSFDSKNLNPLGYPSFYKYEMPEGRIQSRF